MVAYRSTEWDELTSDLKHKNEITSDISFRLFSLPVPIPSDPLTRAIGMTGT